MPKALQQYLQQWCLDNGWTDLFFEQSQFWAFPPGAALPIPLPTYALEGFQEVYSLPLQTRWLLATSVAATLFAGCWSLWSMSPIPLLLAFGGCAAVFGCLDND